MNRIKIGTLIPVVSLVAGLGFARPADTASGNTTATESKSTTKTKSPSGTMKTKTHTASGTVKEFESGKKIVVTTANKKDRSWDLDDKDVSYDVDAAVAVGQRVKVTEKTDAEGHKSVMVAPVKTKSSKKMSSKKSS